MQNLQFSTYEPQASDIANVWPLTQVKKDLGLTSITLHNQGNGNFAIFKKADGTSTTLPCSKKMTKELFPNSRLAQMKDGNYIIVRPEGESTLETLASI